MELSLPTNLLKTSWATSSKVSLSDLQGITFNPQLPYQKYVFFGILESAAFEKFLFVFNFSYNGIPYSNLECLSIDRDFGMKTRSFFSPKIKISPVEMGLDSKNIHFNRLKKNHYLLDVEEKGQRLIGELHLDETKFFKPGKGLFTNSQSTCGIIGNQGKISLNFNSELHGDFSFLHLKANTYIPPELYYVKHLDREYVIMQFVTNPFWSHGLDWASKQVVRENFKISKEKNDLTFHLNSTHHSFSRFNSKYYKGKTGFIVKL